MPRTKHRLDPTEDVFAIRLIVQLKMHGTTNRELAKAIGMDPSTISRYCNGIVSPNAYALTHIARYFDVSVDYLLGLREK